MIEKPIIFSTPMIKPILEDRKIMTRRVIKPQPTGETWDETKKIKCGFYAPTMINKKTGEEYPGDEVFGFADEDEGWICPYGTIGDRLWVKETYLNAALPGYPPVYFYRADEKDKPNDRKWISSRFMPRVAARIFLEITDIKVERIQEIENHPEEIEFEGIDPSVFHTYSEIDDDVYKDFDTEEFIGAFIELWDSINAKRGYTWESNPWVWAITFKRI